MTRTVHGGDPRFFRAEVKLNGTRSNYLEEGWKDSWVTFWFEIHEAVSAKQLHNQFALLRAADKHPSHDKHPHLGAI